jgi:hypothetical protein
VVGIVRLRTETMESPPLYLKEMLYVSITRTNWLTLFQETIAFILRITRNHKYSYIGKLQSSLRVLLVQVLLVVTELCEELIALCHAIADGTITYRTSTCDTIHDKRQHFDTIPRTSNPSWEESLRGCRRGQWDMRSSHGSIRFLQERVASL